LRQAILIYSIDGMDNKAQYVRPQPILAVAVAYEQLRDNKMMRINCILLQKYSIFLLYMEKNDYLCTLKQ